MSHNMYQVDLFYVGFLFDQCDYLRAKLNVAIASYSKCTDNNSENAKTKQFWQNIIDWAKTELLHTEQEIEYYADQVWQLDKPHLKF